MPPRRKAVVLHEAKRQLARKVSTGTLDNTKNVSSADALNTASALFASSTLPQDFQQAQPFRHVVVLDFLDLAFAAELRNELLQRLDVKYRETDLFKFHQTKDISSLLASEQGRARLPHLAKLTERIYSQEFRNFLSQKFELGMLADRVDMAAQAYTQGCHLLCHDDVISTRKLTFVLYLADPEEEPWKPEEGGGMEMYSDASSIPTSEILPDFNVALLFAVEPGRSFHAVREVTGKRVRLSLQGWFHAPSLEETFGFERRADASLQQVLAKKELMPAKVGTSPSPLLLAPELDLAEVATVLRPWVHPQYLQAATLQKLQTHFAEHSEVMLTDVLLPERSDELLRLLRAVDAAEGGAGYDVGCVSGWCLVGPPHLQRFLAFAGGNTNGDAANEEVCQHRCLGMSLAALQRDLSQNSFRVLLECITNLRLVGCETAEVRRFRRGLDYSIATLRGLRGEPCIDVCFMVVEDRAGAPPASSDSTGCASTSDCTGTSKRRKVGRATRGVKRRRKPSAVRQKATTSQQLWESEEVGGFESYIEVDEDEDDEKAEVYRDNDEEGPLLNIPATHNALSIVMRDPGTLSFVKFVSHAAPSSRCDVKLTFSIHPASLNAEEEEGEG